MKPWLGQNATAYPHLTGNPIHKSVRLRRRQFHALAPSHGFMTSMPQRSKSATLRVAREAPRERAMAAI
jgi:hypothetical protein